MCKFTIQKLQPQHNETLGPGARPQTLEKFHNLPPVRIRRQKIKSASGAALHPCQRQGNEALPFPSEMEGNLDIRPGYFIYLVRHTTNQQPYNKPGLRCRAVATRYARALPIGTATP